MRDGLVKGTFCTLGKIAACDTILVCEGYATGASLFLATEGKYAVAVSFNAKNMEKVALILRQLYPNHRLLFCADDDKATATKTGKNDGILSATNSATLTGGMWISPDFHGDSRADIGELTDYNDLHANFGLQVVKAQITHALNRPKQPKQKSEQKQMDISLQNTLKNFAQITDIGKLTNKVYDLINQVEMTKQQFTEQVGKATAVQWLYHPDKKSITRKQVQVNLSKNTADNFAEIFDQYWYIQGTKEVFNFKTNKRQPIETLRFEFPNEFDAWNKSECRQKVPQDNIWFDPSCNRRPLYDENYINTFDGLPLVPYTLDELSQMAGKSLDRAEAEQFLYHTITPLIELIRHLCGEDGKDDKVVDWVLNWLAIPLQNLGTKMDTALIFHGHIQGAGKSLFFDRIMKRIYGEYKLTLGQGQLESQYNDWVDGKLFAVFEEIFQGKDRYSHMGMIKQLITGDTVYINKKFMSGWQQDNFVNVVFLSNEMQPLYLESTDRRHVVLYPKAVIPNNLRQTVSDALLDKSDTLLRAFYTFLKLKDTQGQNAHSTAIATAAKKRLQRVSMSSWEHFYTDWKDGELDVPYMTCLSADLYSYYVYWCKINGERSTSSTKFLTFIGLREIKKRIRYQYEIQNGTRFETKAGQAHAICIDPTNPDQKIDQHWYGYCVSRFKEEIAKAYKVCHNANEDDDSHGRCSR